MVSRDNVTCWCVCISFTLEHGWLNRSIESVFRRRTSKALSNIYKCWRCAREQEIKKNNFQTGTHARVRIAMEAFPTIDSVLLLLYYSYGKKPIMGCVLNIKLSNCGGIHNICTFDEDPWNHCKPEANTIWQKIKKEKKGKSRHGQNTELLCHLLNSAAFSWCSNPIEWIFGRNLLPIYFYSGVRLVLS